MFKKYLKFYFVILIAVSFYFGCSSKKAFHSENTKKGCDPFVTGVCEEEITYDYTYLKYQDNRTVGAEIADILFVIDNSGSMSFEQRKIAERFAGFFDKIKHMDYRIGIITTDVSDSPDNPPREINDFGALQDGRLIEFVDSYGQKTGTKVLTRETPNPVQLFENTIQRPETFLCEETIMNPETRKLYYNQKTRRKYQEIIRENCPSQDERAIYAANLFLDNHSEDFLRNTAPLTIIVVSDENIRSNALDGDVDSKWNDSGLAITEKDKSESFLKLYDEKFQGAKPLSIHSFIVQDNSCLMEQSSQILDYKGESVFLGYFGTFYHDWSQLTGGITGDICAPSYTDQLSEISSQMIDDVSQIILACNEPIDLNIEFSPILNTVDFMQNEYIIEFLDDIKPETKISWSYKCIKQ